MEIFSKIFTPATVVLIGAMIVAAGGFWAEIRNDKTQNQLQEKTAEISKLNEYIASSVTGGNSFPYIQVGFASTPRGLVLLHLQSDGENPLYDVGINFIDNDKAKKIMNEKKNITEEDIKLWITPIEIGNLRPKEVREIARFMFEKDNEERNFTFEIMARNGFFRQQIKVINENGKFRLESEVRKGDKILKTF